MSKLGLFFFLLHFYSVFCGSPFSYSYLTSANATLTSTQATIYPDFIEASATTNTAEIGVFLFKQTTTIPPKSLVTSLILRLVEPVDDFSNCANSAIILADLNVGLDWSSNPNVTTNGWSTSPWSSIFTPITNISNILTSPNLLATFSLSGTGASANYTLNNTILNVNTNHNFSLLFYCASANDRGSTVSLPSPNAPLLTINGITAVCGDGIIDAPFENCDPPSNSTLCAYGLMNCSVCVNCNLTAGTPQYCGDGIVETQYETCDPPSNSTYCTYGLTNCTVCVRCNLTAGTPQYCGDGIVESQYGEQCDTSGVQESPCYYNEISCILNYCNASTCLLMPSTVGYCGDLIVETQYETCDPPSNSTNCTYGLTNCTVCVSCNLTAGTPQYCGDGIVQPQYGEQCDSGMNPSPICTYGDTSCSVCNSSCDLVPGTPQYCGDGIVQPQYGEQCDSGSQNGKGSCSSTCQNVSAQSSELKTIIIAVVVGGGGLCILCLLLLLVLLARRHKKKKKHGNQQETEMSKKKRESSSSSYDDNVEVPVE